MLMAGELCAGFAVMGEYHGQGTVIGHPHFDCMLTIDQSRCHANGRRDPVGGEQPAKQQQQMHQPAKRPEVMSRCVHVRV